ncbi:MAG: phosphoribosylaminoimidazolesuccinocarboxamide synthase [Chloroflexi bacterium]|nr:phosphoribosylaminoimidazolesuccinocarboxamide synthase [Chloroflexota bacterium]
MPVSQLLAASNLPGVPLLFRGKVRDVYDLGDQLLLVATDRLSAFDVVLPTPIPAKGAVLTQLSAFWFAQTARLVPNHLISTEVADFPASLRPFADQLRGRSMLVRRAQRVDVECVVRGYLAGSAWSEYRRSGTVCGEPLPPGLRESEQLPEPIFTPATKAATGHDENISFARLREMVGADLAERLRDVSLEIYRFAHAYARERGIILADTKMEFGLIAGTPSLIDELVTPDSSRFWPADRYVVGRSQPSFDKQFVRDWLEASGWNKEPPAPELPADVVDCTTAKYREAYERLTGRAVLGD